MKLHDVQLIYQYNYWANGKILDSASRISQEQLLVRPEFTSSSLRGTLFHIVDGERLWRVLFETNEIVEEWEEGDFPDFKSLEKKFKEEETALRSYLSRLTDADMGSHLRYTRSRAESSATASSGIVCIIWSIMARNIAVKPRRC